MARLILARHASTAETGRRLTGRLPGVGLTPEGIEQAAALTGSLTGTTIERIYTSPARRCRETARILAEPHGLTPVPYRSLIEVDYGSWSGRALGSLRRTKLWQLLHTSPTRVRFPGGESIIDVHARTVGACEELATAHRGATLLLVTHGDVIRIAAAHYLGVPLDLYQRLSVAPASLTTIDLPEGGPPRLFSVNFVPGGGT